MVQLVLPTQGAQRLLLSFDCVRTAGSTTESSTTESSTHSAPMAPSHRYPQLHLHLVARTESTNWHAQLANLTHMALLKYLLSGFLTWIGCYKLLDFFDSLSSISFPRSAPAASASPISRSPQRAKAATWKEHRHTKGEILEVSSDRISYSAIN